MGVGAMQRGRLVWLMSQFWESKQQKKEQQMEKVEGGNSKKRVEKE